MYSWIFSFITLWCCSLVYGRSSCAYDSFFGDLIRGGCARKRYPCWVLFWFLFYVFYFLASFPFFFFNHSLTMGMGMVSQLTSGPTDHWSFINKYKSNNQKSTYKTVLCLSNLIVIFIEVEQELGISHMATLSYLASQSTFDFVYLSILYLLILQYGFDEYFVKIQVLTLSVRT